MGTKLYVGNLPFGTQEDELRDHFATKGNVVSCTIVSDRETGKSRGFGFVEYGSQKEATDAISELDGKDFQGRPLRVNEARPKENRR